MSSSNVLPICVPAWHPLSPLSIPAQKDSVSKRMCWRTGLTVFIEIITSVAGMTYYEGQARNYILRKTEMSQGLLSKSDLPSDVFSLHHPYINPSITEFEYSTWYFLYLVLYDKTLPAAVDESPTSLQITQSLSSKLFVPPSTFLVSSVEVSVSEESISINMSLTNLSIPHLHTRICHLERDSPFFLLDRKKYRLVQVIHDKNRHLFVRNQKQV